MSAWPLPMLCSSCCNRTSCCRSCSAVVGRLRSSCWHAEDRVAAALASEAAEMRLPSQAACPCSFCSAGDAAAILQGKQQRQHSKSRMSISLALSGMCALCVVADSAEHKNMNHVACNPPCCIHNQLPNSAAECCTNTSALQAHIEWPCVAGTGLGHCFAAALNHGGACAASYCCTRHMLTTTEGCPPEHPQQVPCGVPICMDGQLLRRHPTITNSWWQ